MLQRWLFVQSCGCPASPPLGLGPHLSLGGPERCSSDMAINSDGRGDNKESAAALSRKEIKRGVLGAELQKNVDEPTLCNRQVLVFLPTVPCYFPLHPLAAPGPLISLGCCCPPMEAL